MQLSAFSGAAWYAEQEPQQAQAQYMQLSPRKRGSSEVTNEMKAEMMIAVVEELCIQLLCAVWNVLD